MNSEKFDINKFKDFFIDLVRDINTKNPNWRKEGVDRIHSILIGYLDREMYLYNIIDYNLEVSRLGQLKIQCSFKYYENPGIPKYMVIQERVKTPKEVCQSIIYSISQCIVKIGYNR